MGVVVIPASAESVAPPIGLRRDRVLLGLLGVAIVITACYVFELGSVGFRVVMFWFVQVVLDVGFAFYSWRITRLVTVSPSTRRFWRAVALSGVFFFAADASQAMITIAHPTIESTNGGPAQIVLVACGALICVIAMLTHPTLVTGRERLRFSLDTLTIMIGAAGFLWYFLISNAATSGIVDVAILVASCGLMLLPAFGLVKLLLGGNAPFTMAAAVVGGFSSAMVGVGTGVSPVLVDSPYPSLGLLARLLPCVLLVATPRLQELQVRANPSILSARKQRLYSRLPYTAVGAAQVLLVVALLGGDLNMRAWGVVVAVLVITSIVVIRQLVAFSDNAGLLNRLDGSMLTLRRQEERFRSLVQHAAEITVIIRPDGVLTYTSPAVQRVLGFDTDDALGRPVRDIVHPDDLDAMRAMFVDLGAVPTGGTVARQLRVRRADGSWRWLAVVGTNLLDAPSVEGIVCNARDITEVLEFQDRLRFEATHDPLTRLANRTLFDERIRAGATPGGDNLASVLIVDLDNFKMVNDTLGHHVGDELLVAVAERLTLCARSTDTVARLGGDEFAVLLPGMDRRHGSEMAQRILAAFSEPVLTDGGSLRIQASIGLATGSLASVDVLMRTADAAMYAAKQEGKGTFVAA